ncbi:hypothetical protein BR93DRAFT_185707 [Coniochaeta sp. PMI_546]|nr:hypothetical protein BR93DRAFT_185707 [Coniochaeta sp. PMI_546]
MIPSKSDSTHMNLSRHDIPLDSFPSRASLPSSASRREKDLAMLTVTASMHFSMLRRTRLSFNAVSKTSCLERRRDSSSPSPSDVSWISLDRPLIVTGTFWNCDRRSIKPLESFKDAAKREAAAAMIERGSAILTTHVLGNNPLLYEICLTASRLLFSQCLSRQMAGRRNKRRVDVGQTRQNTRHNSGQRPHGI